MVDVLVYDMVDFHSFAHTVSTMEVHTIMESPPCLTVGAMYLASECPQAFSPDINMMVTHEFKLGLVHLRHFWLFAGLNNDFLAAILPFKPCCISRLLMGILETFSHFG